ncbi:uncharacterized protein LOC100121242 [Nasonia vitripennis]|uniref:Ropporin-1-like protein n=1 Tax=Nasonia vitripennis TaxID=7425 RepID=A0A7M7H6W6_NASVI|nr:uncharacterized protein LOC100121242 [Nasonia vitripennis]
MPLLETDYCIEQINVPPKLPMILKQFCKSAIRTQPYDLLKWSSAYFHALANGEEPPTKLRLEYPPACTAYGLTLGFLKVLLRQLGADYNKVLPLQSILERWDYLCLDRRDSDLIILIGKFRNKCQIKKFLSIAVGLLTRSLTETMITICELFTHEPDGGSAMIPVGLFMEIYGYLASLRCDGAERGSFEDLCLCSETTPSSEAQAPASVGAPEAMAGPVSLASQDTEADIDLELESLTRDDVQSAASEPVIMSMQSFGEETESSFRHEGQASFRSIDPTESSRSKGSGDSGTRKEEVPVTESITKKETQAIESSSIKSKKSSEGTVASENIQKSSDKSSESARNYPDVPGIGRRLLAEEVATVAIWMSECARRQGGMVGPRNIRHINCPPLEGSNCCANKSRSSDDLLVDK